MLPGSCDLSRCTCRRALDGLAAWTAEGLPEPPWPMLAGQPASNEWTVRAIETYLDCPLRFYYDHVLDLRGGEEQSPFLQFQSALHTSIAWMRTAASAE